jgi:antitoxin VapB
MGCLEVDGLFDVGSTESISLRTALPHLTSQRLMVEYFHTHGRKVEALSLNIKNEETYRLAHELADLTGESMTTAVTVAVQERLTRERRNRNPDLVERLLEIGRDTASRLKEPHKSIDIDELLYDEYGLPK